MQIETDEYWMRRAIAVARKGWGGTHPNPSVGAVIVDGAELLAEGYHAVAGGPHAEVEAIRNLTGPVPESATMYVTLEPCSTQGRTPACTDAIIRAGIKRVVVGALDDDARHRGQGLEILRNAGVQATAGVLADECYDLNLIFHFYHSTGRPLIAAKVATTIDGRTAVESGASKWITGEKSRQNVHEWRRYFPAIAVGARTVLADDPALTARIGSRTFCPARLIFDRSGRLANVPDRRVLTDEFRDRTTIFVSESALPKVKSALPSEVDIVAFPHEPLFRDFLLEWLLERGLHGLYVEGGARLHSLLFAQRAVDYLFAYRAPKLFLDQNARPVGEGMRLKDPTEAITVDQCRHEVFGADQLLRGKVCYPKEVE
tara:strand:+ start:18016 stop:19134 length:1119 start_codon:yes stop_codon:yes gene_type:complete